MSRRPLLPRPLAVVLFAVVLSLVSGTADAQLPPLCAVLGGSSFCAAVMSCDPANSFPMCTSTGCACIIACNNNRDCPRMQSCSEGVCEPDPNACSLDRDCSGGKICGDQGICVDPPPAPPCTSDAACDDHDPCNGRETCDGRDCRRNAKPDCDDGETYTEDSCVVDDRSQNTYHCVHEDFGNACTQTRIIEPTIRFTPPKAGKSGRFVFTGTLESRFPAQPPHDLPSSTVRVILVDEKGNGVVDTVIKGTPASSMGKEGWTKGSKGGWSYSNPDPNSPVTRITFQDPVPKKFGHPFEIEGRIVTMPKNAALRPRGGIIVDWTGDISGPCGVVVVPVCIPRTIMGENWMACRERAFRP